LNSDLKRFSGERYRSRLSTHVNFPLNGMDLSRYATSGMHLYLLQQKHKYVANRSVFSLYGVANHTGTQLMGHYTAYTRHAITNKWLLCDDSR
jgi:ubiquitin C-terminal hydrolase